MTLKQVKIPDLLKGAGMVITVFMAGFWVTETVQLKADAKEEIARLERKMDEQKQVQEEKLQIIKEDVKEMKQDIKIILRQTK